MFVNYFLFVLYGQTKVHGSYIDLSNELAAELNFRPVFVRSPSPLWTELVESLANAEYDLSATESGFTLDRSSIVDFSTPIDITNYMYLMNIFSHIVNDIPLMRYVLSQVICSEAPPLPLLDHLFHPLQRRFLGLCSTECLLLLSCTIFCNKYQVPTDE